jgi:hypothetical protein
VAADSAHHEFDDAGDEFFVLPGEAVMRAEAADAAISRSSSSARQGISGESKATASSFASPTRSLSWSAITVPPSTTSGEEETLRRERAVLIESGTGFRRFPHRAGRSRAGAGAYAEMPGKMVGGTGIEPVTPPV